MIYLDHNATTYLHPSVKSKMQNVLDEGPLNPSSIHSYGRRGKSILETARRHIAALIGTDDCFSDYQITFTSSGTESNNLILSNFKDAEIFIAATEHPSILAYNKIFDNITIIKVDNNGVLDITDLTDKLQDSTSEKKLVSIMMANNETGIIQPIERITKIAHTYGALVHSDCIQAAGKIEIDLPKLNVDFISLSAHKFAGPMGAGALIGKASIVLKALIIGGGQERGLRSGTENVSAIAGFGEAASLAQEELSIRSNHMKKLRDKLEKALLEYNDIEIVGKNTKRLPNTTLVIHAGKKAETQLIALDLRGVAVSSGSACSSGRSVPSHVLSAMQYSEDKINSAIRISLGYNTTEQEIDDFLEIYNEINK